MANAHLNAGLAALRRMWAGLHRHWRAMGAQTTRRRGMKGKHGRKARASAGRWPRMRRLAIGAGGVTGLAPLSARALWGRLGRGPLSAATLTPPLAPAVAGRAGRG